MERSKRECHPIKGLKEWDKSVFERESTKKPSSEGSEARP